LPILESLNPPEPAVYNKAARVEQSIFGRAKGRLMSDFVPVARFSELAEGSGKTVAVKGRLIALFLVEGKVHAIDDACPHMGASLADGRVCGEIVACPWHGWRYRVTDGTWVDAPKSGRGVCTYQTRVENGAVELQVHW
jgi:nitrite reductase (NADH) small subunit/3-phenylpropionate/trans-cinnamate dioxygenase ferredoxin subunit